jgi:hypothetical protein
MTYGSKPKQPHHLRCGSHMSIRCGSHLQQDKENALQNITVGGVHSLGIPPSATTRPPKHMCHIMRSTLYMYNRKLLVLGFTTLASIFFYLTYAFTEWANAPRDNSVWMRRKYGLHYNFSLIKIEDFFRKSKIYNCTIKNCI